MASVSLVDTHAASYKTQSAIGLLPLGKTGFPSTYECGDVSLRVMGKKLSFENDGIYRRLHCEYPKFRDGKTLIADITLSDWQKENMVIATPFDGNDKAFYYNAKLNCMTASGYFELGGARRDFDPSKSLAVLDWGRGVWTYKNTWYWSSACGLLNDTPFGFNLGYGFGNNKHATENMLFYNGKAHKLDKVTFEIPKKDGKYDFMSKWKFTSNDNRLDLVFEPILDRYSNANALVICSIQHQVFGKFSGKVVLDDGTELKLKDFLGFAEKVDNRW